jgi:peptidoglycan/LPS O-acetylase OafA/YrhL
METAQASRAERAQDQLSTGWLASLAGAPGRYPVLDALRACAIILVLLRHWAVAAHEAYGLQLPAPLAALCFNGWLGVDLFFVLSGFLIATHFAGPSAAPLQRAGVLEFYRRRAFRTLPLYWGVIALCWVFGVAAFSAGAFSTHLLFLQDYLGSDVLVTLWSLAVEEKFYLLAPLLLWLLLRAGRPAGCALLVLAMAASLWSMLQAAQGIRGSDYAGFFWTVRAPFHHALLAILAGVLVALAHGSPLARSLAPRRWLFWAAASVLLLLLGMSDWVGQGDWTAVCLVIGCGTALCALLVWSGLAINTRHARFGDALPLRLVARLSYALYLVHFPMILPSLELTRAVAPSAALFGAAYLLLSLGAAWLLHVALEKPFLRLRDRNMKTRNALESAHAYTSHSRHERSAVR